MSAFTPSPMTAQRWIDNPLEAAAQIAGKDQQQSRWLAPDAKACEHSDELICLLFDDCEFQNFIRVFAGIFNEQQQSAAADFMEKWIVTVTRCLDG